MAVIVSKLKIVRLSSKARLPSYAHERDSGLDLYAAEDVVVPPGGTALIKTGIAVELPEGTEGQVRPLSGLALNRGVTVLNSPGTVDEGYRGEVAVILINHGAAPFRVEPGTRIAQLVVGSTTRVDVVEVGELSGSERGSRGFGSSGSGTEGP